MGNLNAGAYTSVQQTTNTFYNRSDTSCISWAEASVNNTTVIVNGSDVGDIDVVATGQSDMTCLINQKTSLNIVTQLISSSQTEVDNNTDLFNGGAVNVTINAATLVQTIENNITTITSATCGSSSQAVTNNTLVAVNESTAGDIYVGAKSVNASSCTLNNMIVQQAYNDNQAQGSFNGTNTGMFYALISSLAVIVVVIVIAVIAVALIKGLLGGGKSKSSKSTSTTDSLTEQLNSLTSSPTAVKAKSSLSASASKAASSVTSAIKPAAPAVAAK
jgi:hypothetical protein